MMVNLQEIVIGLSVFICSLGLAKYWCRRPAGTFAPQAIIGDVAASIDRPTPARLTRSTEWTRLASTIDNYLARAQQIARTHTAAMLQIDAAEHALNRLLREMTTATSLPHQPRLIMHSKLAPPFMRPLTTSTQSHKSLRRRPLMRF
jgi:hypothetical protein